MLASGEALGLAGHGADDGDELPAAEAFPVSRPGDLWVCGPHRVLCGNATVDDDVARLLGSETPAMCFTDPPFNVAIGKDSNPKHRQRRGLVNDDLPATDFAAFLERLAQLLAERLAERLPERFGKSQLCSSSTQLNPALGAPARRSLWITSLARAGGNQRFLWARARQLSLMPTMSRYCRRTHRMSFSLGIEPTRRRR